MVVTSPGPALDKFVAAEGCRGFAVDMRRQVSPFRDVTAVARLTALIRRTRPDIVHAHTPKGGLLGMLAASTAGVRCRIYHMRGLPLLTASGPMRLVLQTTERVSCRLATRVLCVSRSVRTSAVDLGLTSPDRIEVLRAGSGQGVDTDNEFFPGAVPPGLVLATRRELDVADDAPVVLFVGRLVRDKGVVELLHAWQIVRKRFSEARLVLVGPYEPRDPVPHTAIEQLAADASVRHVRWTDTPVLYYAMADLVVLPTYREGFPNVLLEAGAMGLSVVATKVPGCVDAVEDGRTGTLVAPRCPEALATAILAYLEDPLLRQRHGEAARQRVVQHFRRLDLLNATADLYDRLLGRGA